MNDSIEIIKDDVSETIVDTQDKIAEYQNILNKETTNLKEVEGIKKDLAVIKNKISDFTEIVFKINSLFTQVYEHLEFQQEKLNESKIVLLKRGIKQLNTVINSNLPDGIRLVEVDSHASKWTIVASSTEFNRTSSRRPEKKYVFDEEENNIGELIIEEENDILLVKAKIEGEEKYEEFIVKNTLRVFPIINYVINKYFYKEESEK